MNRCRQCGGEYADDLVRCPVDGEALASDAVPVTESGASSRSAPTRALGGDSPAPVEEPLREARSSKRLEPGTMVGEYRVTALLEEGGMGIVYAGVHPVIGKQVAIKVLSGALSDDESMTQRFIQEARAVNQIQHHNIVDIFAFGRLRDGRLYCVMELLAGQSLKERRQDQAPLSYQEVISILMQVCDALVAAHAEAIVHRDLKPANIFLVEGRDQQQIVKLLDFGIAKLLRNDQGMQKTQAGVLIGTPEYMSPEQCLSRDVGARSDIYSLGIIMFELFTGRLPCAGDSAIETMNLHVYQAPPKLNEIADLPEELADLVLACLTKDPQDRPQSADEVRERLRKMGEVVGVELGVAAGCDAGATPLPPPRETQTGTTPPFEGPARRFAKMRKLLAGLGALVLALALGAGGLASFRGPEQKTDTPAPSEKPVEVEDLTLQIVTQPAGATVYLNGDRQDLFTPFAFQIPRAPEVEVRLVLAGYQPHETTLSFGPDEKQKALQVTLQALGEQLDLSRTPPDPSSAELEDEEEKEKEKEEESAREEPPRPRGEPTTISNLELERVSSRVGDKKTIGFKLDFADPDGDVRSLVTRIHPPEGRPRRPKRMRLRLEDATSGELSNTLFLNASTAGPHRVEVWIRDRGGNESPHLSAVVKVVKKGELSSDGEPTKKDGASSGEEKLADDDTPDTKLEKTPDTAPEETPDTTPEEKPDTTPEEKPPSG